MPFYDFCCTDCGSTFERRLSMAAYEAGDGRSCPGCDSVDVERAFTAVNVLGGKGSGKDACCQPSGFT